MKDIKFYKVHDEYGFMSNFAPYPFSDGSRIWPTSEHYFQAQKFLVPEIQEINSSDSITNGCRFRGTQSSKSLRPDWEEVKDGVMLQALRMKFRQNPEIARELLAKREMPSSSNIRRNDAYWADGGRWLWEEQARACSYASGGVKNATL